MKVGFCAITAIASVSMHGHDNQHVHPLLTKYAFEAWYNRSQVSPVASAWGISDSALYTYDSESKKISDWGVGDVGWLNKGSIDEDDPVWRCLNHFYNPLGAEPELTDPAPVPGVRDSYTWATEGDGLTGPNLHGWEVARTYAFQALDGPLKSERDIAMARMFYALGMVLHLNQDLSQPEHTRNDAHLINGQMHVAPHWRWIENYGLVACRDINLPAHAILAAKMVAAPVLDWRTASFTRLKDFWDTNVYDGSNASALDDDASGVAPVGLAEFSNGNFLGGDSLYFETTPFNKTFPYPRLSSVSYASAKSYTSIYAASKLKPIALQDGGSQRFALFLEKDKDGVSVEHHSMLLYSLARVVAIRPSADAKRGFSIQSLEVLKEYHEILLPKAISYSAGLLDYFFRGKLEVASGRDSGGNHVLSITNRSGQTMLGGRVLDLYR